MSDTQMIKTDMDKKSEEMITSEEEIAGVDDSKHTNSLPSQTINAGKKIGKERRKKKNQDKRKRKIFAKRARLESIKTNKEETKEESLKAKVNEATAETESHDEISDWSEWSDDDNAPVPEDLMDLFNSGMVLYKPTPKTETLVKPEEPHRHIYVFEFDSDEEAEADNESEEDDSQRLHTISSKTLLKANEEWTRHYPDDSLNPSSTANQPKVKFVMEPLVHILDDEDDDRRLDADVIRSKCRLNRHKDSDGKEYKDKDQDEDEDGDEHVDKDKRENEDKHEDNHEDKDNAENDANSANN